eukprot:846987_1
MATLHALQSWYTELPQNTKLKIVTIGTAVAFGGLVVRNYLKSKQPNGIASNSSVSTDDNTRTRFIIPLSFHRVFWGSYLLSAGTLALTFSSRFNSICNQYIPRIMSHKFTKTFVELLPPIPKTLSQSFKLGQLEKELTRLEQSNMSQNSKEITGVLSSATNLLGLGSMLNAKQLHGILARIVSIETQKTTLQRIRGVFKFVNIMWGLSIVGISVTVLPVVYFTAKPIWDELYNFFKKFLTKIGNILSKLMFNETAYTVYETAGYVICWYCMYLGLEKTAPSTIGYFTCVTGLGLWLPIYKVSFGRHTDSAPFSGSWAAMTALFISALTTPLAYRFKSSKLEILIIEGMASVGGLYYYLCSVIYGLGRDFIEDVFDGDLSGVGVTASLMFNIGLITLKLKNVDVTRLEMFVMPTCIIGCTGIYSALLSYAHERGWFWYRSGRSKDYFQRQYTTIVALLTGIGFGTVLNLPAMSNTAYVYTGLYVFQKMFEYKPLWDHNNAYFTVFGGSVITWRLALYLHKNPQIFANMIKFE